MAQITTMDVMMGILKMEMAEAANALWKMTIAARILTQDQVIESNNAETQS